MAGAPKDGGTAFPAEYFLAEVFAERRSTDGVHEAKRAATGTSKGMSLRDWFAGQAIGHVIENCAGDIYAMATFPTPEAYFARKAYQVADAMLAAREASDG